MDWDDQARRCRSLTRREWARMQALREKLLPFTGDDVHSLLLRMTARRYLSTTSSYLTHPRLVFAIVGWVGPKTCCCIGCGWQM
eukprot:1115207-Rhodomonas_salina.1